MFPGYRSLWPFLFVIEQDVCDEPSQYNTDTNVHTTIL